MNVLRMTTGLCLVFLPVAVGIGFGIAMLGWKAIVAILLMVGIGVASIVGGLVLLTR